MDTIPLVYTIFSALLLLNFNLESDMFPKVHESACDEIDGHNVRVSHWCHVCKF